MVILDSEVPVYKIKNISFILTEKHIIVKTPLQEFYLLSNDYWTTRFSKNRICLIREMIKLGEIRDLNDLAGYTRPGIQWTNSRTVYNIDNCRRIEA